STLVYQRPGDAMGIAEEDIFAAAAHDGQRLVGRQLIGQRCDPPVVAVVVVSAVVIVVRHRESPVTGKPRDRARSSQSSRSGISGISGIGRQYCWRRRLACGAGYFPSMRSAAFSPIIRVGA